MQLRRWSVCCLVCILLHIVVSDVNGDDEYTVGRNNYEKTKSKTYKTSATTVSSAIAEVDKTFYDGMIGEINKVTEVDGNKKVGFFMKKMPFLRHIPKLAGVFGAFGTMLFIITSFLPKRDSPELTYMKKSFSDMNRKLDGITNSLEESKNLVKEYSQKAVYLKAEHNIITAYEKYEKLVPLLIQLECNDEKDCKRKKIKLVEDQTSNTFNVRADVQMIMRGATQDSVFGTSLLKLISESSGCNINRIKNFHSAIAALATKGSSVAAFHDTLHMSDFDMTADMKQFQNILLKLEKKKDEIISECYSNIKRYIFSDNLDKGMNSIGTSIKEINQKMVQFLSLKYPWITFYVVSVKTNTRPITWGKYQFQDGINAKGNSDESSIKHFILFGSKNRVENEVEKVESFRSILSTISLSYISLSHNKYDEAKARLLNAFSHDKYLHNQVRAFVIVPEYEDIVVGYMDRDLSVNQVHPSKANLFTQSDLTVNWQCVNGLICSTSDPPMYVIATLMSVDQDISECSETCNNHGKCFFLPLTKSSGCKCHEGYYGSNCNQTLTEDKMALDLSGLMDIAFKIPSLSDISHKLEDIHVSLQSDMSNIQNSIQALDKKLTTIFNTMSRELMSSFDWHGLITQYGKIVRDLKYFYHVLVETTDTPIDDSIMSSVENGENSLITKEKEEMARDILKPNQLRSHLYYLNYLFLGRKDISLVSHKSILFHTMDKHRNLLCSAEYKLILDKVYKQLLLLQFQGYILWIHALKLLEMDTSFVVRQYKEAIDKQREFFERKTCQIKIDNSLNFNDCTNGYYIYSGMKEEVKCAENYYINTRPVTLYVDKIISVTSELSNTVSSAREVVGPPCVYPTYGNNSKAWSPSMDEHGAEQVIEVAFHDPMFIKKILVYETFHGGAVWKIEGLYKEREWKTLMEKPKGNLEHIQTARINTINVQSMDWSTSRLRIRTDSTKSGQAIQIDAVGIEGNPTEGTCSWYTSKSCNPCGCDVTGSSSLQCSVDGKCTCKDGFKGQKCDVRDCVMDQWQGWSACACGPRRYKTRDRSIQLQQYGKGKACESARETAECNIPCVCGEGERGDYCEHKDCLVTQWGTWDACPHQNDKQIYICVILPPRKYVYRRRHVRRRKENNGHGCPHLTERKACPLPQCISSNFFKHAKGFG